ncbi:MAG: hypothetical protein WC968_02215 [Bacilli bacterium]
MKDKLILNLVHRPEMVPEYAEKIMGHGEKENLEKEPLLKESLDIFKLQQQIAHEHGLKTTIQMTYASLFNEEAVALAKAHHAEYGDEIALTLLGLPSTAFRNKYKTKDFCIWMFSYEDKKRIVDDVFSLFFEKFGFYPQSTGSYYMDADLINYIKEKYPSVICAIATCWEEGPKAYHATNNSWYTFMDGGPWNPWIPSKINTHVPAENESEDSGIVAIPHLSRDLNACFDGNGSNFGTHPQNVLRGMAYKDGQYPYLFNLIDQYRHLGKFNDGYAYNMMFVGPGWMNKMGRWEQPYTLLEQSYKDGIAYYGKLKKEGKLIDLTMSEFAHYYRANKTYKTPEVALWQDILYGSEKQYFWYLDPYLRTCVDLNQGGALIDLRPYVAKLYLPVGIGTPRIVNASYPFLIQANYRAGYFTHYAGEGTLKSTKVSYEGEEIDLALCLTKATFSKKGDERYLHLDPIEVVFKRLTITIATTITFKEATGEIRYARRIIKSSDPHAKVTFNDYMTGAFGTTEYPEEMYHIRLRVNDAEKSQEIKYHYANRELTIHNGISEVIIPDIETRITMKSVGEYETYVREGYAFSPMYTLGVMKDLKQGEEIETWLKLEKAA